MKLKRISYKTAELAKEKGFPVKADSRVYYVTDYIEMKQIGEWDQYYKGDKITNYFNIPEEHRHKLISAPFQEELHAWLRTDQELYICMSMEGKDYKGNVQWSACVKNKENDILDCVPGPDSYESILEDILKKSLNQM